MLGAREDIRVWRAATGAARFGEQFVRFGVPGQADISGIVPGGGRVEIEVKSPTGRQADQQRRFQAMIERFGGIYVLARSADEALAALRARGYCRGS